MQSENERDAFVSAAFCCEVVESAHVKCRRCRSLFFIFFFYLSPFSLSFFFVVWHLTSRKGTTVAVKVVVRSDLVVLLLSLFFFVLFSSCVRPSVTENAV